VTRGSAADGFIEVARELLDNDLSGAPTRHRVVIGTRGQHDVTVPPAACSILLCGPIASGKAALCNGVLSQYLQQQYQCCIIGAYSSRAARESFERLTVHGDEHRAPTHADVLAQLEQPQQSVVVNLAAVRASARPAFVEQLIEQLAELQSRAGRPHVIVLDQAEGLLTAKTTLWCMRARATSIVYASAAPRELPHLILESVEIVIALGDAHAAMSCIPSSDAAAGGGDTLEPGQALLWFRESGTSPQRVELDARPAAYRPIPEPANSAATQARARSARFQNNEPAIP
jgi:hypothetical protein